ncbi:MAG: hypothetical protein ACJ8FY_22460 [Gemmataceae bacterium]
MNTWQQVWHQGLAPSLSTPALEALHTALVKDDPRVIQGATTLPPPIDGVQSWPVEAACVIGFSGWQGHGLESVAQVEQFFACVCSQAEERLGETAASRWFLNWYDTTARTEVRHQLLAEVEKVLEERRLEEADSEHPNWQPVAAA